MHPERHALEKDAQTRSGFKELKDLKHDWVSGPLRLTRFPPQGNWLWDGAFRAWTLQIRVFGIDFVASQLNLVCTLVATRVRRSERGL